MKVSLGKSFASPCREMFTFRSSHVYRNLFVSSYSTFKHLLRFSTVATENPTPTHFMVNYLVSSIGLSTKEAISASKRLTHIRSTRNANLVHNFFRESGLNETQIRYIVSLNPSLLTYNVEKTLKPKLRVFQDLGLSDSGLVNIIVGDPCLFLRGLNTHILPSIGFLLTFLGSKETVIKAIEKSIWLISCNAQKKMQPNILFLQKCGLPDQKIKKFILRNPRCFLNKPIWFEKIVGRVEKELEISRESGMFPYGIEAVCSLKKWKWESKSQIFKSFGWSEFDIVTMVRNLPLCMNISVEKIRRGLKFFMGEMGYMPEYIAFRPKLLMYSLDKRVVPRHTVLRVLKERNLIKKGPCLYSILCMQEFRFLKEFLLDYKDEAPDVYEAYINSTRVAKAT